MKTGPCPKGPSGRNRQIGLDAILRIIYLDLSSMKNVWPAKELRLCTKNSVSTGSVCTGPLFEGNTAFFNGFFQGTKGVPATAEVAAPLARRPAVTLRD